MIHDSTFLKELKYEKVKKSKKVEVEAVESGIQTTGGRGEVCTYIVVFGYF